MNPTVQRKLEDDARGLRFHACSGGQAADRARAARTARRHRPLLSARSGDEQRARVRPPMVADRCTRASLVSPSAPGLQIFSCRKRLL